MPDLTDWIMAASAAAGSLFAGALLFEARRQARINERQVEIAAKQAQIQQAQHDLLVQQDTARKPVLEIQNVTVARWEGGALWFNAEIANAGRSQVAPNAVLLKWNTPDGRQDGKFGRVLHRAPRREGEGSLLLPGDVATFVCMVQLPSAPNKTSDPATLTVLAVDGTQSAETFFGFP